MSLSLVVLLSFLVSWEVVVARIYHAYPDPLCASRDKYYDPSCGQGGRSFCDCVAALSHPGDECRLHAGRYFFNGSPLEIRGLHGEKDLPYVIAAYSRDEGEVVLDGTAPLSQEWRPYGEEGKAIFTAAINQDVWQLFVDDEMQTNARWPNALWRDKSVFNVSYWATSSESSKAGVMIDDGSKGLASSGMDVTGAVAILNTGSWNTYPEIVLEHEKGSAKFLYNATGQYFHTPPRLNHYYLEDMLQFLDQPTEWFYNASTKRIFLWPEDGNNPSDRQIRGKVSTYALNVTDCTYVTFANFTFFATTVWAASLQNDQTFVDSLHFSSVNFSYPSYSKRMLRSSEPPQETFVSSRFVKIKSSGGWQSVEQGSLESTGDSELGGNVFCNCSWTYADGAALTHVGTASSFINNYFAYNDWSAATETLASPAVSTINSQAGSGDYFYRNTLYRNGASTGYRPSRNATVLFNHIIGQCWGDIQHDGAGIQVIQFCQNQTLIAYNWVHDSVKYGVRFDGKPPKTGIRGTMRYNVAWNSGGLLVKGDNHTVDHNLAFQLHKEPDLHGFGCTLCVYKYVRDDPVPVNNYTVTLLNAADKINGGNCTGGRSRLPPGTVRPLPGVAYDNINSDVFSEVMDARNWDFRPRANSSYRQYGGVGPYQYNSRYRTYWIPGRASYIASTPIPPNSSQTVRVDTDSLMWLQAFEAKNQTVFFTSAANCSGDVFAAEYAQKIYSESVPAAINVFFLPVALKPEAVYCWRVDTIVGENSVYVGDTWSFNVLG